MAEIIFKEDDPYDLAATGGHLSLDGAEVVGRVSGGDSGLDSFYGDDPGADFSGSVFPEKSDSEGALEVDIFAILETANFARVPLRAKRLIELAIRKFVCHRTSELDRDSLSDLVIAMVNFLNEAFSIAASARQGSKRELTFRECVLAMLENVDRYGSLPLFLRAGINFVISAVDNRDADRRRWREVGRARRAIADKTLRVANLRRPPPRFRVGSKTKLF